MFGKVTEYLKENSTISAAYLFGSFATGRQRPDSDVDIAVLFIQGIDEYERFDQRLQLACELESIVNRQVDVIDLLAAPLLLRYEVRRTGQLLFEKFHDDRIEYEVRTLREYFDFLPRLEFIHHAAIERM